MTDPGPRPSALVVDDDPSLRMLCRVNLELDGFDVREAASPDEARAAVDARRPDVVLLDVHLGNDSSESLMDELKGMGIGVVLVTGTAEAGEYRPRVDDVITKPFLPDQLVAAARRVAVR